MKDFKKGAGSYGGDRKFGNGGGRPSFGDKNRFSGNSSRPEMHSAVCDKCHNKCEVPFRPSGDKPIYCNNCFGDKRDSGGRDNSFDKGGFRGDRSNDRSNDRGGDRNDRGGDRGGDRGSDRAPSRNDRDQHTMGDNQSIIEIKKQVTNLAEKIDKITKMIEDMQMPKKDMNKKEESLKSIIGKAVQPKKVTKETKKPETKKAEPKKPVKKVADKKSKK